MTSLFRAMCALVTDILSGAVLQPLMDILPNPDMCINLLIDLGFSPEPSKKFGPPSGERVEYLEQVSSSGVYNYFQLKSCIIVRT